MLANKMMIPECLFLSYKAKINGCITDANTVSLVDAKNVDLFAAPELELE